jgi:hypothetical protein
MSGLSTADRLEAWSCPTLLTYYAPDDMLQGRRVFVAFNRFDIISPHSSHMAAFQPRATDSLSPLHGLVGMVPDTTVQAGVPRLFLELCAIYNLSLGL